jgi:hypothetical protein
MAVLTLSAISTLQAAQHGAQVGQATITAGTGHEQGWQAPEWCCLPAAVEIRATGERA